MADAAQDPSQDQEFLKAPPTEQHAYLMDSDPDYAKGSPEDQQAYLAHIHATAARNEPPASRALSAQTGATARAAGESQRTTRPILPVPTPSGPLSRFVSGYGAELAPKIPSLESLNPFTKENAANIAMGPMAIPVNMGRAALAEYQKSRAENQPVASSAVAAGANPLQFNTEGIRERAKNQDYAGLAGMTAADISAALLGPRAIEAAKPALAATRRGGAAVVRRVGEPFTIGSTGEEMMTKGISPRAQATGFKGSLAKAGPDIKGFHNDNPIKSVQDLDDAIPEIKQKIWTEEVDPALARQAQRPVDMAPVAQNVRAQITPEMREFDEANANKLDTLSDKLERARDVGSANRLLKYVNGQLDSYFAKYPSARRSNLMNNPETAGWEGARQALRQQFLQTLEDAGERGIRDARLRYGALEDIGKEVERRVNVADRAKPMSLPRILGILGAIPSGGLSVALGEAAHYLNKPDVLVRRGIAKLPEPGPRTVTSPTPYVPPEVNIRGLLPEAPILTPPPADTSGPVDLGEPTVLPLAENRQLPAAGQTTGPPVPKTEPPTPKAPPTNGAIKAAREVMAQTPSTSRATPTGKATIFEGENGKLPAELHAQLEKQAGRKLSTEDAIALDRANAEKGMAGGKPDESSAIREEHRSKLESKGRPEPPAATVPKTEPKPKAAKEMSLEEVRAAMAKLRETPTAKPEAKTAAQVETARDIDSMSHGEVKAEIPKLRQQIAELKAGSRTPENTSRLADAYDRIGKLDTADKGFEREKNAEHAKQDKAMQASREKSPAESAWSDATDAERRTMLRRSGHAESVTAQRGSGVESYGTRSEFAKLPKGVQEDLTRVHAESRSTNELGEGVSKDLPQKEFFRKAIAKAVDAWKEKVGPEAMEEAQRLTEKTVKNTAKDIERDRLLRMEIDKPGNLKEGWLHVKVPGDGDFRIRNAPGPVAEMENRIDDLFPAKRAAKPSIPRKAPTRAAGGTELQHTAAIKRMEEGIQKAEGPDWLNPDTNRRFENGAERDEWLKAERENVAALKERLEELKSQKP